LKPSPLRKPISLSPELSTPVEAEEENSGFVVVGDTQQVLFNQRVDGKSSYFWYFDRSILIRHCLQRSTQPHPEVIVGLLILHRIA
jgi:hypothetical protein